MEMVRQRRAGADEAKKNAGNPKLRLFTVKKTAADTPQTTVPVDDYNGKWLEANEKTIGPFSAVAYYFGRDLAEGARRAGRHHPHLLGRHRLRGVDQHEGARRPPRAQGQAPAPGEALQRHDRPAHPLRHQGRHLVSGRVERRPGRAVPDRLPADDPELARRLEAGRLPVPVRAARPVHGDQQGADRHRLGAAARGPAA